MKAWVLGNFEKSQPSEYERIAFGDLHLDARILQLVEAEVRVDPSMIKAGKKRLYPDDHIGSRNGNFAANGDGVDLLRDVGLVDDGRF